MQDWMYQQQKTMEEERTFHKEFIARMDKQLREQHKLLKIIEYLLWQNSKAQSACI